jgi:hypothetical protein
MIGLSAAANAFFRHVYSYVAGAMTVLGIMGVSPDMQQQIVASVHQIGDGVSSILAGVMPLVSLAAALYARWTAKPDQQVAAVRAIPGVAVVAQGSADAPSPAAAAKLQSHWVVGLLALAALAALFGGARAPDVLGVMVLPGLLFLLAVALLSRLAPSSRPRVTLRSHWSIATVALGLVLVAGPLGGCTITAANGDQVVLTPQNALPLVVDQIKQGCAAYDANKVTADALADVATNAINNAAVTGATKTVRQIATDACPLIEAVVKETTTPAAPAASSSTPPTAAPASSSAGN